MRSIKPGHSLNFIYSAVFAVILAFFPRQDAIALDWNTDYGVSLSVGHQENFRLTQENEIDSTSSNLNLFADLEGASEITRTTITLRANSNNYSESEIDDSDGYSVALDTQRRGERLSGSLGLALASESTTDTELLDTGNVIDGERETASIAPGLAYQLTERNSLNANFDASDVTYDTESFTEYKNNSLSVGWGYRLDEASSVSLELSSTEYDPEDDSPTDINSTSIGYEMSTSKTTRYLFRVGYSDLDSPDGSETSGDYRVEIEHGIDERNSLQIELSNSYVGGGSGEVRDEDQVSVGWAHSLSDKTQLSLNVRALSNDDRDYGSVSFGGSYRYTRELTLGANMSYRRQEANSADAEASGVFVSLSYSPI